VSQVPEAVLSALARQDLDPLRRPRAPASEYRFPWQPDSAMVYGGLGVHKAGFIDGWKAVDFLSDGNTAAGHAPNRLLAAAAGTIDYVCDDGSSEAIRIGDLLYVHLALDEELVVGRSYDQGQEIGQLKPGPFNGRCGWTSQPANWFHLHWGFPGGASFQAGGWTLDLGDGLWRRDEETRGTGGWFTAEGEPPDPSPTPDPTPDPDPTPTPDPTPDACPAPTLLQPADGATLAVPVVAFRWDAVSGCTFDGYDFRVCTTANLDDVENCLVDAAGPGTEWMETLDLPEDQVLTWGVRAASAPGGAPWAGRNFRMEPAKVGPTYLPLILVGEKR
jgi:hypothetical protein